MEFLVDLGVQGMRLEVNADAFAHENGLISDDLPDDARTLQKILAPALQDSPDFRMIRMVREWQLDRHGWIAMDAFEEIRTEIESELAALQQGPTSIAYDPGLSPPDYWAGREFHRSAGGWDGHDFMGFVHGELIHRRMIDDTRAGMILQQRAAVAKMPPLENPQKILEMGCGSGQYTEGIAAAWPSAEIWGCDLSPRQLEEAQRRANEQGLKWHLFQAAAEDTGLDGEQFDFVTSYAVFHELPVDVQTAVLAESCRLLKPGGFAVMGDIKAYHVQEPYQRWKADFWNQLHGGDPFWRGYATTDQAALAKEVGFSEAEWFGVGENQYPWVLVAKK